MFQTANANPVPDPGNRQAGTGRHYPVLFNENGSPEIPPALRIPPCALRGIPCALRGILLCPVENSPLPCGEFSNAMWRILKRQL
jgi:hypothetical protein